MNIVLSILNSLSLLLPFLMIGKLAVILFIRSKKKHIVYYNPIAWIVLLIASEVLLFLAPLLIHKKGDLVVITIIVMFLIVFIALYVYYVTWSIILLEYVIIIINGPSIKKYQICDITEISRYKEYYYLEYDIWIGRRRIVTVNLWHINRDRLCNELTTRISKPSNTYANYYVIGNRIVGYVDSIISLMVFALFFVLACENAQNTLDLICFAVIMTLDLYLFFRGMQYIEKRYYVSKTTLIKEGFIKDVEYPLKKLYFKKRREDSRQGVFTSIIIYYYDNHKYRRIDTLYIERGHGMIGWFNTKAICKGIKKYTNNSK